MADNDREILSALDKLTKKLDNMMSKLDSTVRSGNRSSAVKNTTDELGKAAKSLTRETKTRAELMAELSSTDRKVMDSLTGQMKENKKYTDLLQRINNTMQNLESNIESQKEEIDQVVTSSKKNRKDQQRYLDLYSRSVQDSSTAISQNIKKSSLLGAALLRSSSAIEDGSLEYHKMMENLYETSKPLGENILRYANAWDESAKAVKSSLSRSDFAEINLKIGAAAAELADSMKDTGFSSIEELLMNNEDELLEMFKGANDVNSAAGKLKTAMISAALGLEQSGLNVGAGLLFNKEGLKQDGVNDAKLRELNKAGQTIDGNFTAEGKAAAEELINIIKNLGDVSKKANVAQDAFTQNAVMANTELGKLILHYQDARKTNNAAVSALKTLPKTVGLVSAAGAQIGDVLHRLTPGFNAVMDFNASYVPIDFKTANIQAIQMGMSLEETTKYMQENKNTMALYGKDFGSLQARMTQTATNFGLTMNQAASTVQPAISAAIASGVNVTNQDSLFNSIDETLKGFTKLSGVLNITTEQYAASNAELLTSHDVQANLLGLDNIQTQQTARSLILQRDEYAVRLGSLAAAQDLLKLQAQQGREKIMERTRAGAFAMLAGQQAGMSQSESIRLYQISQKADSRRTAEERKFLTDAMGKISLSQQQQVAGASNDFSALAVENMNEKINEQLGTLGSIGAAQQSMFARDKAGANVSTAQQETASKAAAANVTVAEVGQSINQVSAFLNNTFLKSLFSSSAALVGLTVSALSAARNLQGIAGGGFGGFDVDPEDRRRRRGRRGSTSRMSTPSTGANAGKLAKGAGTLLKGGVAGIVGGVALDYASDKLTEAGHEQAGAAASVGSSALSGAGLGAMIGSVFPVIGTGIGAAIGAGLGGAYGMYQNWDTLTEGKDMSGVSKLATTAMSAIPGLGILAAGKSLISPMIAAPSSTNAQSVAVSPNSDVNKVSILGTNESQTDAEKNLAVSDTAAREHLSELVEAMQKSIVLLQQIANNTVNIPEPEKIRTTGMNPILPAAAVYQGRS